jgi:hypothetical protein
MSRVVAQGFCDVAATIEAEQADGDHDLPAGAVRF